MTGKEQRTKSRGAALWTGTRGSKGKMKEIGQAERERERERERETDEAREKNLRGLIYINL